MAKRPTPSEKVKTIWDTIYNGLNGGGCYMYAVDDFEGCETPEDVIRKHGVEKFVERWNACNENASQSYVDEWYDRHPGSFSGTRTQLRRDQQKLITACNRLETYLTKVFPEHKEYLDTKMDLPTEIVL